MKFTCEKNAFAREISLAQEIIASRNALSIMSNVYLEAADGTLVVRATDIKTGFETRIPVDVAEAGSMTVFCDKLTGILSSIPEGTLEFAETDSKVVVKPSFKKVRFQLKTISSEKFPELPAIDEGRYFSVPSRDFKDMIRQTCFAVSDDETRYFMNGVYVEKAEGGIVMVATDGRRLAYVKKDLEAPIPDFKGIIVPPKVLSLVLKHAPDDGPVDIAVGDKNLFVKFGAYVFSTVLIEGQFPNYQKVIPENQVNTVVINKNDLLDSLKRVGIFVEQKSRRTFLTLTEGLMTVSSEESELGTAREEVPCRYSGPDVTIALNYKYLEDPLRACAAPDVSLSFNEPTRSITVKPDPESFYFHIVMPMQLDQE